MKTLLTLFTTCITTFLISAQMTDIDVSSVTYEETTVPSVSVHVEPDTDWLKEAFEDYMKDNYRINMKGSGLFSNKDVLSAEEINMPIIADGTINFYAKIVPDAEMTRIDLFARGNSAFFKADSDEIDAIEGILSNFLQSKLMTWYEEKLEEITETQEDLNDDIADLEKDIQKNKDDIAKKEREIVELKSENETSTLEIEELQSKLDESRKMFEKWQNRQKDAQQAIRKIQ